MPGPQNAGLVGGSYYSGTLAPKPSPPPGGILGGIVGALVGGTGAAVGGNPVAPTIEAAAQQTPVYAAPSPQPVQSPAPQAALAPQQQAQAQQSSPFSAINSFPGVTNSLALEQQGLGQLNAQLDALRQRAIINYGDPALASMAGFGLDPQAGAFARQNYLSGNSTLARIDKQHQQNAQAIINALAAHGILNSGDLGYREGQENQGYGNNVYDAQQSVLGQLTDAYNNYLSQQQNLHQGTIQAQLQALQEYLSNPDAYSSLAGLSNPAVGGSPAPSIALPQATTGKTTKSTPATRALATHNSMGIGGHY